MATDPLSKAVRNLRLTLGQNEDIALPDAQLLSDFIERHDDASFAVLVRRHGPLVMGVCRRVARDRHDAEDAFQAAFLVLVRRAASIARRELLANWLYRVAYKTAVKIQTATYKRRARERQVSAMPERARSQSSEWSDLMPLLDQELSRLPEMYRIPVILCDLEGKTHKKAAQQLGCPENTLTTRLVRARAMLAKRLTRHGFALSAASLALALSQSAASAKVAPGLVSATVKAASAFATGLGTASGVISIKVIALAEGVLRGMAVSKVKLVLLVVAMGLGLAAGGVGWASKALQIVSKDQSPIVNAVVAQASQEKKPRVDQHGDELPEGAVARLGTVRFRHDGHASALMFTPDGKGLVGLSLSGVVIWDLSTGKERIRLPVPDPHSRGMDISPDGSTLVIAQDPYQDARISFWNLHTGNKTRIFTLPKEVGMLAVINHIRFSPDGKALAFSSRDGRTVIIDSAQNTVNSILGRESQVFYNQAFSSDGKSLIVAVYSKDALAGNPLHEIQLWDSASAKYIRTIADLGEMNYKTLVRTIAFIGDGKRLHYGTSERFCLVDLATGKKLSDFKANWHQALTPDGTKLVTWNGSRTEIRDAQTGAVLHTFNKTETVGGAMALSPDGKTVANANSGSSVRLWDVATGEERFSELEGHHSAIRKLAFSADGKKLFSSASNGGIFVWDSSSHERIANFPIWVRTMAASPDGTQIATSDIDFGQRPGKVRFWNVSTGKEALTLDFPNTDLILNQAKLGR